MLENMLIKKFLASWNVGDFVLKFNDGSEIKMGEGDPKFALIFKKPLISISKNFSKDLSLVFAEGYMAGDIDIIGDYDEIARVIYLHSNKKELHRHDGVHSQISQNKESKNIKSHYDLGNDFYKLWLDETMSYSCAYFKHSNDSLYQAQINKIEHTLKKLDLKKGEKLLDIGCGWGWLAVTAAKKYGVKVVGITISEEQFKRASERVIENGLEGQVEIRLQNYQDLPDGEIYDKIVSVGMFEHVGKDNIALYLSIVKNHLKTGGLFLLHSITSMFEGKTNAWIDKYIFPGGYLPSMREVFSIACELDFHMLLAESLRYHYAKTLQIWYDNFQKVLPEVRKKYDEKFIRMWGLYLKSCSSAFSVGSVDLFQLLMTKGVNNELPLTKEYIYK